MLLSSVMVSADLGRNVGGWSIGFGVNALVVVGSVVRRSAQRVLPRRRSIVDANVMTQKNVALFLFSSFFLFNEMWIGILYQEKAVSLCVLFVCLLIVYE